MNRSYSVTIIIIVILGGLTASILLLSRMDSLYLGNNNSEVGVTTNPLNSTEELNHSKDQTVSKLSDDREDLVFRTLDGDAISVNNILAEDKLVLIYFYTTWCPACKSDLHALNEVYSKYKDDIVILAVSVDPSEDVGEIKKFKEKWTEEWIFVEYNQEALLEFKIVSQASKVLIATNGETVFNKGYGMMDEGQWDNILGKFTS